MEGRGRSRARKKRRYASPKRLLSFLLTAAMVLTNMGPDLSLAYAATATDVTFEMEGADLVQSVEDAIAEDNEVTKEDINFTEGAVDKFENLFFGEGKLYEAYPEMEGGDAEAELRVFVRLPEDADDTYIVTGDEDLIFLYVNNGEDRITCKAEIHSVINGRERTKTTKKVSIKSYLNAYDTIFGEGTEVEEEEEVVTATSSDADKAEPEVPTATDSDGQVSLSVNDVPLVTEAPVETATDSDAPESDDDEAEVPEDTEAEEPAEEEEITEDVDKEVPEAPKATDKDLVALDWNRTAKAWVTSLNALGLERSTEEGSYVLTVNHILTDGGEMWGKEETIELTEEDFTNGVLNTAPYEYVKDGMELAGKAPVVRATDFQGEDGTYELTVDMEYRVMDGWHIVRETAQSGIMLMAIYIGELDEVDIEPDVNQIPVHVQYVYEGGVTAKPAETIMAVKEDPEAEYVFELEVKDIPSGYYISIEDDEYVLNPETNTITRRFKSDTQKDSLVITFVAVGASYKIQKYLQELNGDYTDGGITEASGTAGEVTEVVADTVPGYTALPIKQQEIKADGTTVVDVYYVRNTYTVTYDTNGGSYVKALKGLYGQEVPVYGSHKSEQRTCTMEEHTHSYSCYKRINGRWTTICGHEPHTHSNSCYSMVTSYDPAPTKQGYTFAGWYTDEEFTQRAAEKLTLVSDTTVYAKWDPAQVRYTVVYYIENADDDNYSYLSSEVKTATVGTSVQETADTVNPAGLDTTNFTFESSEEKMIAANGSTVIRVNYARKKYILKSYNEFTADGEVAGRWEQGEHLTLSAKYGATITDLMNKNFNVPTNNYYAWSTTGRDGDKVAVFDTMPSGYPSNEIPVYNHTYSTERQQVLRYWLENYNGSKTSTKDGKTYGLYKEITVRFQYIGKNVDFYDFPGYTQYIAVFDGEDKENWSQVTTPHNKKLQVDFYYDADEYTLDLFGYNGEQLASHSVKLGANIQSYLAEPEKPVEGATFKGWYLDPQRSEKYAGDYKMPQGLSLYADWDLPTYTVTYVSEEETIHTESVEYLGTPASYISEKEGYVFEGWYADKDGVTEADLLKPVESDITVYAQWSVNTRTQYTILYQTEDGINVRDPETFDGIVGTEISVKAKTPTVEAYKDYAVNVMSETITLQAAASQNVITFIYTTLEGLTYTVQYKYGNTLIHQNSDIDATASQFRYTPDKATVEALKAKGYNLIDAYKDVQLVSNNEENIVVFNLSMDTYTITYEGVEGVTAWGGETKNPNPITYTVNSENITLVNPSKNGSEFTGWACDDSTEVLSGKHDPMEVVIEKGSTGNLTFTAGWDDIETENITGDYADAEDENPNDEIYHQGEADLAVYLDGELVQSDTLKYGYQQYACVDMAITLKGDYILNSVYADQVVATENPTDIYVDGNGVIHVDNVADESTVYVYLTTKYTVKYVTTPAGLVTNPTDNNVYTVVNKGTNPDGYEAYLPSLAEYLTTINVQAMPQIDGYTATGWTTEAGTPQNAGNWALSDALDADAAGSDTVITLTAMYGANSYAVGIQYYYDEARDEYEGDGQRVFGTTYTISPDWTKTHGGKTYALDRVENNSLTVSADLNANIVKVYYALDEKDPDDPENPNKPDGVPDKYQAVVTYKVENGTFGDDGEQVTQYYELATQNEDGTWTPETKTLSDIPEPTANTGYENGSWNPVPTESTEVEDGAEYTHTYVAEARTLTVNYIMDDEEGTVIYDQYNQNTSYDAEYDLSGQILTEVVYKEKTYLLDSMAGGAVSGTVTDNVVITLIYSLDANDDGVADKYQTTVTFKAVNGYFTETNEDGTETKVTETQITVDLTDASGKVYDVDGTYVLQDEDIPKATPDETYTEPGTWSPVPQNAEIRKDGNRTFTITFSNRAKYEASIEYYYDDVLDESETQKSEQTIEEVFKIDPPTTTTHGDQNQNYVLGRIENNGLTVSADPAQNVIRVYYELDVKGEEPAGGDPFDPDGPDNIPDKYQVIFRYTTDGNGTVTGKTYERYTTPKDEDGNYTEFNGASPEVNVTVSGNTSRYVFDYWTDDNGNQYDTDDVLRRAKFDDDTTFTAHFRYVSGGGNSGGGGGGSSGGGSPYSDPDHGPGVVNIDPDAVPLAPLPGNNMFVIEDGDVPLAPLPKTGQTPVAPAMGMLFAGIFLALASLRRREEEN